MYCVTIIIILSQRFPGFTWDALRQGWRKGRDDRRRGREKRKERMGNGEGRAMMGNLHHYFWVEMQSLSVITWAVYCQFKKMASIKKIHNILWKFPRASLLLEIIDSWLFAYDARVWEFCWNKPLTTIRCFCCFCLNCKLLDLLYTAVLVWEASGGHSLIRIWMTPYPYVWPIFIS